VTSEDHQTVAGPGPAPPLPQARQMARSVHDEVTDSGLGPVARRPPSGASCPGTAPPGSLTRWGGTISTLRLLLLPLGVPMPLSLIAGVLVTLLQLRFQIRDDRKSQG
jgi:hypothetical protein